MVIDMENNKRKVLLIVNPCAGRTKSRAGTFDIVNKFSNNDYEFSIHTTTCQGDATNIVKKNYEGKDIVVCCGGDGTLNETINGVMEMPNRVPIGYIPSGSTNDLASTLGIPNDIKKATDLIMAGHTNSYDIGLFNNRYFSYVASFGAFTRASYQTSQKWKNRIGHAAYLLNGIRDWGTLKPVHMKIEHDGGVIEDDFMFGSISNSTSVAGLFKFSVDDVRLNDGYFEVLLVKKLNFFDVPVAFSKIVKQQYDGEQIIFLKTRSVKITSPKAVDWTLDGEYGGSHKTVMLHVLSKAVDICSPENELFEKDTVSELEDEPMQTEDAMDEEAVSEENKESKEFGKIRKKIKETQSV
ncbi:MAG: YegS/Rv2252/BmrU family lipid kinase [Faecalibacterium sp.]|nr:YegS/Rv2252/BmrU family lipid kinase [Ruminococcus sp.]MCM1392517.1 YegS/Rv2252/BmrU family lipid kinase [Ruminococcus sp.]MCM1485056.1 YegS/Rv2252/BmrU family lipid kinase [Faecalibacterium sp.]